jgi:murein DD-endopeptidase MepM/ murein hydrolase activator NlpD
LLMLADTLRHAPPVLRANLPWIVFAAGIGAQAVAVRLAAQRPKPVPAAPTEEIDIVASDAPADACELPMDLPEMTEPVAGANVPTSQELLPGADRRYRGGVHEGVDFRCRPDEPVFAAADGWVLTIEDGPNLPESQRDELLQTCRELGETPPEVLRALHGRQITLRHETSDGHLLTTSYSHLSTIQPGLEPGDRVRGGEVIGTSGASGTSHAYRHDSWGELHFELRIDGQPLGVGLRPTQAGDLYRKCFGERQ